MGAEVRQIGEGQAGQLTVEFGLDPSRVRNHSACLSHVT